MSMNFTIKINESMKRLCHAVARYIANQMDLIDDYLVHVNENFASVRGLSSFR